MPVFISYSHTDEVLVNKLAANLIKHKTNVWIDTWELNVGDSIIDKIQEAIDGASALLVILSQASVASEWCKKELNTGLIRELDEKRVVVLPVLIEDCNIPLFLRDKVYADMRHDMDKGINQILSSIAKVTNSDQSRFDHAKGHVDWGNEWGYSNNCLQLKFNIVQTPTNIPMTFLTQVTISCDEITTSRYNLYEEKGLGWFGRNVISELLFENTRKENLQVLLDDSTPETIKLVIQCDKTKGSYYVVIEARRLGEDNGKDQLLDIGDYFIQIQDHLKKVSRKPTAEELKPLADIIKTPWTM